jgi:hypothetical protein
VIDDEEEAVQTNYLVLGPGCSGDFWNNPNIKISTGVLNAGHAATIKLTIQNTNERFEVRVNHAEAIVCALNTMNHFTADTILPSLRPPFVNPLVVRNDKSPFPDDLTIAPAGSIVVTLGPWTPTGFDLDYFDNTGTFLDPKSKKDLHACVFAFCNGSWPPPSDDTTPGNFDGTAVNWATFDDYTFCADQHHGQHNTTLHRTLNQSALTVPFYAGIAGGRDGDIAKVFQRERAFDPQVHRDLVEMISLAGLDSLPIQPALLPARVAGIARFRSTVERIDQKVEEIVNEAREALEHLQGHWADEDEESDPGTPRNVVTLQLAPGKLQPLLLKVALDKDDPLGAVHVFDVVQLNKDGTRGGFRLATINTPAE